MKFRSFHRIGKRRLSCATTCGGVLEGAKMQYQFSVRAPARPASATVGTSGNKGERTGAVPRLLGRLAELAVP